MMSRFLLDTNIVIALFTNAAIVKSNLTQANGFSMPNLVVGEPWFGDCINC
ncbi:hypothetical protein [Pantanalinema sp. GBBB05]|uniref:hypothetical protein n=1 Tax=Pantanalinema sp. GBBB05 TaxID=2604139 RepID=UPI001D483CB2|nr:type II toxin-antitoxin system VapC family toxin [Pantanalinema sp. GBBB05]